MRRIRAFADHFQRKISLYAGAHVEVALVKKWPAPVRPLDALEVDGDFLLKLLIDRLAAKVAKQHVFGRNGRVRLKLEHPMSVTLLDLQQRPRGRGPGFLDF